MTNKLVAAGCLMTFIATPVFADEAINSTKQAIEKAIASEFNEIDTNHDMKINMEELSIKGVKIAKFKKADIDSDGSLSKDEFIAYNTEEK